MAYMKVGNRAEAVKALTRATEINPYYWRNFFQLGFAAFNLGENQSLAESLPPRHRTGPRQRPWMGRPSGPSITGLERDSSKECIDSVQKAIAIQPDRADFYSQRGVALFFSGHPDESLKDFSKAVGLEPNNAFFRTNLADAYRWSDQKDKAPKAYGEAIQVANKALEVNPQDAFALGYLATCYAKTGETKRALDYIQQARRIEPDDNDLMYREAVVYASGAAEQRCHQEPGQRSQHGYSIGEVRNDAELAELRKTPRVRSHVGRRLPEREQIDPRCREYRSIYI